MNLFEVEVMNKMKGVKTAKQMAKETRDVANNLPTEIKQKFWKAITEDGKNLGEARRIAGIDDILVAAELVILCHKTIHIPMAVEDVR